jgi:type VI protein secretion system component VasK
MEPINTNAAGPQAAQPVRQKRKWLKYLIIGACALVAMIVTLVVAAAIYWNHLVKTYATTTAQPLPKVEITTDAVQTFQTRLAAFQAAMDSDKRPEPLAITGGDLNAFMGSMPPFKDKLFVEITNNILQCRFVVPLDKTKNKQLKDKFINGRILFRLTFQDGYAVLSPAKIFANNTPIPWWLFKRIARENFLQKLYDNTPAMEFFQNVQSIDIQNNTILIHPLPPQK